MESDGRQDTQIRAQALLDFMKSRRSIRAYKPDPVPREYVEMMLEAARWAPNGEDMQPWRFVIVDDKATILKLGRMAARMSGGHFLVEYLTGDLDRAERFKTLPPEKKEKVFRKLYSGGLSGFVGDAPLVVVACHKYDEGQDNAMDLAAATENLLLMAHALGLGACWVVGGAKAITSQRRLRLALNLPDNWYAFWFIPIGFPTENPRPRHRKPLSEITCRNEFGQPYPWPSTESEAEKVGTGA